VDDVVISGTVVPEPAAGILAGMVLFAGMARRRRPGE
jgi:hypothetical protein